MLTPSLPQRDFVDTPPQIQNPGKFSDPKLLKRGAGGRQCISPVVIYRKCTQRTICMPFHGKGGFLREKKSWANRGRPLSPWIRRWMLLHRLYYTVRCRCHTAVFFTWANITYLLTYLFLWQFTWRFPMVYKKRGVSDTGTRSRYSL